MEYTEKEKRAIENIKDEFYINGLGARYTELKSEDLEIFLSLLEKQKKQIERLEKTIDENIIIEPDETGCHEELNIHIKDFIPKDTIKEKIKNLSEEEKKQLKGTKGQDRYSIKQEFMYKRSVLEELL